MHHQNPLNLPEIQSHLARYLSRHDLLQCARVCKSWSENFLPHVWSHQRLSSYSGRRPNTKQIEAHRHWVRTLELDQYCQGYVFNYPKLHSFTIKSGSNINGWLVDVIKLNPTIAQFDSYPNFDIERIYMDAISALVNLDSLSLRYAKFYLVDTLDALWKTCHKLKCLKLWNLKFVQWNFPVDVTYPWMKKLVIYDLAYLEPEHEVRLMSCCPQLTKLTWSIRYKVASEATRIFVQLCRQKTWPNITMLHLRIPFEDDDVETILESMVGVTKLTLSCKFGQRASVALAYHFHSLEKLDLKSCNNVPSTTLRDVLCSCPRLLKLSAGIVEAQDILEGGDWVCTRLKTIRIRIVFLKTQHNEAELHLKIFERMGRLVDLEEVYFGNENVLASKDRGLDFRLGYGLEYLINMKQLRHINFIGSKQAFSRKELDWITNNLPKVVRISGRLNKNLQYDADFRRILKARGIGGF